MILEVKPAFFQVMLRGQHPDTTYRMHHAGFAYAIGINDSASAATIVVPPNRTRGFIFLVFGTILSPSFSRV
jgi:hypothetical protein